LYDPGMRVGFVADAGKRRGDGVARCGLVAVCDAARSDFAREVVDAGKDVFPLRIYYWIVSLHVD
jgi:hypothetical protein